MKNEEDEVQVKELFDLNLAFKHKRRKKKMKRHEGRIYELLQMRDQMLRLDPMRRGMVDDGKGLHLIHLLLISGTAVDDGDAESAVENLYQLYQHVSLSGDSVQRVAAYFADGLSARLVTKKSPSFDMIMKQPTPEEDFLAFTGLYKASPYYQFAHFTANQEIIQAFEAEEGHNNSCLHVIDFDVSYGFQWPSLIQSVSEKTTGGNRISLRITGFGRSLKELAETETRLVNFAGGCCNLTFEFHGLLRGSEAQISTLRKTQNETLVVNLVLHLHTQKSNTLKLVHSLNPSILVLVERETNRTLRTFLSRFMESLHYFAAMFDSLDDCLSPESSERLCIEKNHLGREIKRTMNYNKDEEGETWKGRMESNGFAAKKLSSRSVIQAKLLLQFRSHSCQLNCSGGFRVLEKDEGCALSLGWQDRLLITASAWKCI